MMPFNFFEDSMFDRIKKSVKPSDFFTFNYSNEDGLEQAHVNHNGHIQKFSYFPTKDEILKSVNQPSHAPVSNDQSTKDSDIRMRLGIIESKLNTILSKLDQLGHENKAPQPE